MKILITITSCVPFMRRGDHQVMRETWLKDLPSGVEYKFFVGNGKLLESPAPEFTHSWNKSDDSYLQNVVLPAFGKQQITLYKDLVPQEDEIVLDVPDIYQYVSYKTRESHKYAMNNGYDFVFQCCADTFVITDRLMRSEFERYDYSGFGVINQYGRFVAGGAGYWLSAKACRLLAGEPITHWAEDAWVGQVMHKRGIGLYGDPRYENGDSLSLDSVITKHLVVGNAPVACADRMRKYHKSVRESRYSWFRHGHYAESTLGDRPAWDGSLLPQGTLLLHTEHNLEDTLQFLRFARFARQRCARVVMAAPVDLLPLLRGCAGIDACVARGEPLPAFDAHAPLLSLPHLLSTSRDALASCMPYLTADEALRKRWHAELASLSGFKVGICWQGEPEFPGDQRRSIPLRHFAPLAKVTGARLIGLQRSSEIAQLALLAEPFEVVDLAARMAGESTLMDTAALLSCLDLVVTGDAFVAHLAGALGVPVWLALPAAADWRWPPEGSDCPWYPTMRLYRQPRPGDWKAVFDLLAFELGQRLGLPRPSPPSPAVNHEAERQHRRGLSHLAQGQLVEAIACLRHSLLLIPDCGAAHHNLGVALGQSGRLAEAVLTFQEALRLRPDAADTYNNLGGAYLRQGRVVEAEESFRRGIVLTPRSAELHNNLGLALEQEGRFAEAASCYREGMAHRSDRPKEACPGLNRVIVSEEFALRKKIPSDINEHLETLHHLASECSHVTEFGVGNGNSSIAFLAAKPSRLVCYGIQFTIDLTAFVTPPTHFAFVVADTSKLESIEQTDLLFIYSPHDEDQLRAELKLNRFVNRYIIVHATETHLWKGEQNRGDLLPLLDLLLEGDFVVRRHYRNNNGLTVLERKQ